MFFSRFSYTVEHKIVALGHFSIEAPILKDLRGLQNRKSGNVDSGAVQENSVFTNTTQWENCRHP